LPPGIHSALLAEVLEARFQVQVAHLRQVEAQPANYHVAASGFLADIDCMRLEVREYLSTHPTELEAGS
jgi:hypothetical protein